MTKVARLQREHASETHSERFCGREEASDRAPLGKRALFVIFYFWDRPLYYIYFWEGNEWKEYCLYGNQKD